MLILTQFGIFAGVYLSRRLVRKLLPSKKIAQTTPTAVKAAANKEFIQHNQNIIISGVATLSSVTSYLLYPPLNLLNIAIITYTTAPIMDKAELSLLQHGEIKNDSVAAITSLLCIATGTYFGAAMHNLVYHLSCRFTDQAKQTATNLAAQAYTQQPIKIWIEQQNKQEILIEMSQIRVGDRVVVNTGEVVPIDGTIAAGLALIDQQALTGESAPCEKHTGDPVHASSIVLKGRIYIEATHSGIETQTQKLNDILAQTRDYKSQLQLKGEEWTNKMALPLLATSALMVPLTGLVPATALLFSAPFNSVRSTLALHTATHLEWAAKQGVFIKDGRALEQLPLVDVVLFDKTGTLTQTRPQVAQTASCGEFSSDTLLVYAAAAEQHLHHPIAEALRSKAADMGLELPLSVQEGQYEIGLGVNVLIDGQQVHVGSQRYITEVTKQTYMPRMIEHLINNGSGHTFIFIAINHRIEGVIELYPQLRPEVPTVINLLRKRGIRQLAVVSGDQLAPTQRLADTLGLDKVYAEMLPQQKAALIESLQQQGHRVCFIGDGLNDAIAMKQANVSICLTSASDITSDMAHVLLLKDNLIHLRDAFDVADHLTVRLASSLLAWLGFGALNALSVPLFRLQPAQSSLLFAGAYTLAYRHATTPTWLETVRKREADELRNTYEGQVMPMDEAEAKTAKAPSIISRWVPATT